MKLQLLIALECLVVATSCLAQETTCLAQETGGNWPCFRGPNRAGTSTDKGLPVEWSDTQNIVWKTELPGAGASSPITFGERIYLTCYSGYGVSRESPGKYEDLKRHVVCLSPSDGAILWDTSFSSKTPHEWYGDFTNRHGLATSTPAADETGVYAFFGTWGARAYSHAGELKWERSCGDKFFNYGSAASPVLFGDLVIVNASVEDAALIALEKQSGRERWRVAMTAGYSYATPLLLASGSSPELVYYLGESAENDKSTLSALGAVDPQNGNSLWQCRTVGNNVNPSPIAHDGVVFAIAGDHRAMAVRAGGRGDVTATHKLWDVQHGTGMCTPVFFEGHLYWVNEETGIAYCVKAADGDVIYKERLEPRPGAIYASGVIADGKLYYVSRENGTFVLPAASRFELLAHNKLASDESLFNSTPAVRRGRLLLRSDKYLYCIGEK
jgi:outer membrane protein assembly factor BamB